MIGKTTSVIQIPQAKNNNPYPILAKSNYQKRIGSMTLISVIKYFYELTNLLCCLYQGLM